jgi:concentrative nucleoside transporter, CNT family
MDIVQGVIGVLGFGLIAWALSERRMYVPWRMVGIAFALMVVLAVVLLKFPPVRVVVTGANEALIALERATTAGTSFVFGYLGGGNLPFDEKTPGSSFVLAFKALPLVIVVSALSALLFYWRVLPMIVGAMSRVLEKVLGVGGAVGVSTAANVFLGTVEAPLVIKPYLSKVSRGELFMIMTCGMASTAGTVMALYASILGRIVPDAIGHILVASFISMPAALLIAAIMVPPEGPPTAGELGELQTAQSSMDAVTQGTLEGVNLLIAIIAMLIVLGALVYLANSILGVFPNFDGQPFTLQRMFGWILAPLAWLSGVSWSEATTAGSLLGTKTVLNEFIAYIEMAKLPPEALSERSRVIMTYALCGFANFSSLGIMIGGMSTLVPARRQEIISLGMKSILSGLLSTCLCAAVVSMVI